MSQGEHKSLQLGVDLKLGEDVRHVVALCTQAYVQPLCYPRAIQSLGERLQDLYLTG
jgi:hypothetical protein